MTRPHGARGRHMAHAHPLGLGAAAARTRVLRDLRSAGRIGGPWQMHLPLGPMLFGGTARHPRIHTFSGRRGSVAMCNEER